MKQRWLSVALLIVCAFVLMGSGMTAYLWISSGQDEQRLRVQVQNGVPQPLVFQKTDWIPGETVSYTVLLTTDPEDDYRVTIDCSQGEVGMLTPYIWTQIYYEERPLCEGWLTSLMEGESLCFQGRIGEKEPMTLTVSFTLAETVGNELQGERSSVEWIVTISNE